LEDEGLLESRGTAGRFVTADAEALFRASERIRREAVRTWLAEARALGLSREDLIRYMEQEELT
jgi:DNA-binding transcriptional regulator YhcF (GntR family)